MTFGWGVFQQGIQKNLDFSVFFSLKLIKKANFLCEHNLGSKTKNSLEKKNLARKLINYNYVENKKEVFKIFKPGLKTPQLKSAATLSPKNYRDNRYVIPCPNNYRCTLDRFKFASQFVLL